MPRMNYQDILDEREFRNKMDMLDKFDVFGILDILDEPDIEVIEDELRLAEKSYLMHRNAYPRYVSA